ncbi:MAG TPA: NAD(P)H-dependent glycerol-3-phosphate dehydrogenase [Gemmatimonadales bacterium]|nr:NAD(P)H-dependent glycerol-3-phosphate dehydrogenase [Gemmatimonadales bacterium]
MSRIGVLGAGSWGTTLADLLARNGHEVCLWAYEPEVAESVNARRENPVYLAGCRLAEGLSATSSAAHAVRGADLVLCATPSHAVRAVLSGVAAAVPAGVICVSATKGLEPGSLKTASAVIGEVWPETRVVVLSGPSFALEVFQGQPTAVCAASRDEAAAGETQRQFSNARFRVYGSRDPIGVELGGALKNVIAIAAGILEGLGLGHNPRAALITRGLAEITRLGVAMGADPMTFAGLAGMGDLVLTATGQLSRNRTLGVALAKGQTLAEYSAAHRTVAEGVGTAQAAVALGERYGVELPICHQVSRILFEGKPPAEAVKDLMERALKMEQWR